MLRVLLDAASSAGKVNSQGDGWREQEVVARLDKGAETIPPYWLPF